jgi:hypothetical protein
MDVFNSLGVTSSAVITTIEMHTGGEVSHQDFSPVSLFADIK